MASVFHMRSQRPRELLPKSTALGQLLPRPGAWGDPQARFLGYGCVVPLRSCHPPSPPPQAVVTAFSHCLQRPSQNFSSRRSLSSDRPSLPEDSPLHSQTSWQGRFQRQSAGFHHQNRDINRAARPLGHSTAQQEVEESRLCEQRGQGSRRLPFRRPRFSICEMWMVLSPAAWARVCESSGRGAWPAKVSIHSCVHQLVDM